MREYCVGFLFNDDLSKVALIKKNRPDWQAGLLNGIGGKVEYDENSVFSMAREFREETGVHVHPQLWKHTCTLRFPYAVIDTYAYASTFLLDQVTTITDEEVLVVDIHNLSGVVRNVPQLVELCRQRLQDKEGA